MDELLKELILYLKEISPQMWDILVLQVYFETATNFLVGAISAAIAILLPWLKWWNREDNFNRWMITGFTLIFVLIFLLSVGSAIQMLVNPEYYAVKLLVEMIK